MLYWFNEQDLNFKLICHCNILFWFSNFYEDIFRDVKYLVVLTLVTFQLTLVRKLRSQQNYQLSLFFSAVCWFYGRDLYDTYYTLRRLGQNARNPQRRVGPFCTISRNNAGSQNTITLLTLQRKYWWLK